MNQQNEQIPQPDAAAALLDPQRLIDALRAHGAPEFQDADALRDLRVDRCWPASGAGLRFQWSLLTANGERRALYGSPLRSNDADQRRTRRRAGQPLPGRFSLRIALPEYGTVVHTPDCDLRLRQLRACLDAAQIAARLEQRSVQSAVRGLVTDGLNAQLVGYKPEKRAAIVYRSQTPGGTNRMVAKTHHARRGVTLIRHHRRLADQFAAIAKDRVRVPKPVAYLPELNLSLFEWLNGRTVGDAVTLDQPDRLEAALEALATLHACDLDDLPRFTLHDELRVARRWVDALRRTLPEKADAARSLCDQLVQASETIRAGTSRVIHRDFHEKQLVWDDHAVGLLDLDTIARGDPCLDLGNFIAHLYLYRLQTGQSPAWSAHLTDCVLRVYETRVGIVDRRNVALYCASALIRGGALHALRTSTRRYAASLWSQASRILGAQLEAPGITSARNAGRRATA